MKLNDNSKGAFFCLFILVLMAIAGTCDYQDAVHFNEMENDTFKVEEPDTTESAYDVIKYVQTMEKKEPQ